MAAFTANHNISGASLSLHALVWTLDGDLYGYGYNELGQVGDGTTQTPIANPIRILGDIGANNIVGAVASEVHSVAWDDLGQLYTWGDNTYGQLGTGDRAPRFSYIPLHALIA